MRFVIAYIFYFSHYCRLARLSLAHLSSLIYMITMFLYLKVLLLLLSLLLLVLFQWSHKFDSTFDVLSFCIFSLNKHNLSPFIFHHLSLGYLKCFLCCFWFLRIISSTIYLCCEVELFLKITLRTLQVNSSASLLKN